MLNILDPFKHKKSDTHLQKALKYAFYEVRGAKNSYCSFTGQHKGIPLLNDIGRLEKNVYGVL